MGNRSDFLPFGSVGARRADVCDRDSDRHSFGNSSSMWQAAQLVIICHVSAASEDLGFDTPQKKTKRAGVRHPAGPETKKKDHNSCAAESAGVWNSNQPFDEKQTSNGVKRTPSPPTLMWCTDDVKNCITLSRGDPKGRRRVWKLPRAELENKSDGLKTNKQKRNYPPIAAAMRTWEHKNIWTPHSDHGRQNMAEIQKKETDGPFHRRTKTFPIFLRQHQQQQVAAVSQQNRQIAARQTWGPKKHSYRQTDRQTGQARPSFASQLTMAKTETFARNESHISTVYSRSTGAVRLGTTAVCIAHDVL